MPLLLADGSQLRPVQAADIKHALEGHPVEVLEVLAADVASTPGQVTVTDLRGYLESRLAAAVVRAWRPRIAEKIATSAPDLAPTGLAPRYAFVAPPDGTTAESPLLLAPREPTRTYSTYRRSEDDLLERANQALMVLAAIGYEVEMPQEEPLRSEKIALAVDGFNTILGAAERYPIVQVEPALSVIDAPPGGLPAPVNGALASFAKRLALVDTLDPKKVSALATVLGVTTPPAEIRAPSLGEIAPAYLKVDGALRAMKQDILRLREALEGRQETDWWLDGAGLATGGPVPASEHLRGRTRKSGEHIIVPGLEEPPTPFGEILAYQNPLILVVSDMHMGQGTSVDAADEVYPSLEAAFIEMLEAWAVKVNEHRTLDRQPAYLVLDGDILDFWSADMVPAGAAGAVRWQLDTTVDAAGVARVTPAAASARMERIIAAHKPFFDRVRSWVDADPLNFVVYVCGNHDDHLVRFGLGEALAARLHPARGAFAAQSLYFPHTRTIIEHGHRGDQYNAYNPSNTKLQNMSGSLGEMIVMMMVNPAERGGHSVLANMVAAHPGSNVFRDHGLTPDDLQPFHLAYDHFARCAAVSPRVYRGYMSAIDNISRGGLEDVVCDLAGKRLAEANAAAADAADVCDLDDDVESLKGAWLSGAFQTFLKRYIARPLSGVLSPGAQAWLVGLLGMPDLGFDRHTGLFRNSMMKVHISGHTHDPNATDPAISGAYVPAQHVNCGTGQDTWDPTDRGQLDIADLTGPFAVVNSPDSLAPIERSKYCLVKLGSDGGRVRILVHGAKYRTLQSFSPQNVESGIVRGGLWPCAPNRLDL